MRRSFYFVLPLFLFFLSLFFFNRDLKPENILLAYDDEEGEAATIKIVDFGFAAELTSSVSLETRCGSYCEYQ
jgi:serine/threonine protein kinase